MGTPYCKLIVDHGLVKGMMLKTRTYKDCDLCHLAKQRQKSPKSSKLQKISGPNELIYADLLFPPRNNGTRFPTVLIIRDRFSRFMTMYPVKTKEASEVNPLTQRYIK